MISVFSVYDYSESIPSLSNLFVVFRKAFKKIHNILIFNRNEFVVMHRFDVKICDFNHTDTEIFLFTFLVVWSIKSRFVILKF